MKITSQKLPLISEDNIRAIEEEIKAGRIDYGKFIQEIKQEQPILMNFLANWVDSIEGIKGIGFALLVYKLLKTEFEIEELNKIKTRENN